MVKFAEGDVRVLQWAVAEAIKKPIPMDEDATDNYRTLASIAWHLSQLRQNKPFWLPVNPLAEMFGISPTTISKLIKLLQKDGIVKCVREKYSFTQKKAKEYIFTGKAA